MSAPANVTVEQALSRSKQWETRKSLVTDPIDCSSHPASQRLLRIISLRQLVQSEPTATVISLPQQRTPITVSPVRDREHLSHIISKYNLLAVPVVDADERVPRALLPSMT